MWPRICAAAMVGIGKMLVASLASLFCLGARPGLRGTAAHTVLGT